MQCVTFINNLIESYVTSPSLAKGALLVKFFCRNQCKCVNVTNGPLLINGFKAVVERLDKTGSLKLQSCKRYKPVPQDTIQAVGMVIGDISQDNIADTFRASEVAWNPDMPSCSIWKI